MSTHHERRILRVLDYIRENLDGDLSLDKLAEVAAMSRYHWHRVFTAITGETLAESVRRLRLHRAACWLVQTDKPVSQIAREAGYGNHRSFSYAFTNHFGLSPAAFRSLGAIPAPHSTESKGEHKMYPVDVTDMPERRLAAISHIGPYIEIGSTFEKLGAILSSRNLWPAVQGMVGVYYDDPRATPADRLRSHAGFVMKGGAEVPEGLDEVVLKPGKTGVLHYMGPYSGLQAAYDYMFGGWVLKNGAEPADEPCYEVYLNSPMDTEPRDLLTDVCVPLK